MRLLDAKSYIYKKTFTTGICHLMYLRPTHHSTSANIIQDFLGIMKRSIISYHTILCYPSQKGLSAHITQSF